jgi:hypothetical protein
LFVAPILEQEESHRKSKRRTREMVRRFEFVGCNFSLFGLRYSLRKPQMGVRSDVKDLVVWIAAHSAVFAGDPVLKSVILTNYQKFSTEICPDFYSTTT